MKTIGANLLTHLQGYTTTLADLWKVTRTDGQVFGFTSLDADLYYAGTLYQASSAWSASSVKQDSQLAVGSLEITGYLSSGQITQSDAEAGLWDGATVEMLRVNHADLTQGHETIAVGELGEVRLIDGQLVVELRGFLHKLQNVQGRVFLPTCDAAFGDTRCGVDTTSYTHTGTVTSVVDRSNFTASAMAQATHYFRFGVVTWTAGSNNGRRMEVKAFTTGGVFELQLPMSSTIAVGDTFSAVAGCDKTADTCKDTFSNLVNFRGYPHIPGLPGLLVKT